MLATKTTDLYWKAIKPNRVFKAKLSNEYEIHLERIDTRKTHEQGAHRPYRAQTRRIGNDAPLRQVYLEDAKDQGPAWAQLQCVLKLLDMHLAMHPGNGTDSEIIKLLRSHISDVKPKLYAPITLQQALKVSGIWESPDECVWIVDSANPVSTSSSCMTVKQVKERLDTKRTLVYRMDPQFVSGEYYGTRLIARFIR